MDALETPALRPVADGGRRLSTMVRHATHTFAAVLWLLGLAGALHAPGRRAAQVVPAVALLGVYVAAGWVQQLPAARGRRRLAGAAWVAVMLGLWAVLAVLGPSWTWLSFPLEFLALFILGTRRGSVAVVLAAAWAVAAVLLRGDHLGVGQVVGPLFGAGFAVVVAAVFEQLRRDAAEQRRLSDEVARLAAAQARTTEREAIARDLHDTLAQQLNSIVMLSRAGRDRHPDAADVFGGIEDVARDGLRQARGMVHDLAGHREGAGDGVARVVADVAAQAALVSSGLELAFASSGRERALPAPVEQALVMVTRSLLANVVQHARASRCQVSLSWFDDEVCLDVVDDGVGFTPGDGRPDSFGLRAVRERVARLDGDVEVDTAPGDGTAVQVRLPLGGPSPAAGGDERQGERHG